MLKRLFGRTRSRMPAGDVVLLRSRLLTERYPIMRHVIFTELERGLYAAREDFTAALDEFDDVCLEHDAEMPVIRAALLEHHERLPEIELYALAARRCRAAGDEQGAARWVQRGLEIYGDTAVPEAVAKLARHARTARQRV
jgi:hypothetical protein